MTCKLWLCQYLILQNNIWRNNTYKKGIFVFIFIKIPWLIKIANKGALICPVQADSLWIDPKVIKQASPTHLDPLIKWVEQTYNKR